MKPTYEELEAKCQLQQNKLDAINKLMGVIEGASDLAKSGIEKLEQQLAVVVAENAGLKKFPEQIVCFIGKLGTSEIGTDTKEKIELAVSRVKTPATDAYLAEVRASEAKQVYDNVLGNPAVTDMESLVDWLEQHAKDSASFATQLRQGAEHE